jgi:hypothetical protein
MIRKGIDGREGRGNQTYFLDVDAVACAAEDERCSHGFCESAGLFLMVLVGFFEGLGFGNAYLI